MSFHRIHHYNPCYHHRTVPWRYRWRHRTPVCWDRHTEARQSPREASPSSPWSTGHNCWQQPSSHKSVSPDQMPDLEDNGFVANPRKYWCRILREINNFVPLQCTEPHLCNSLFRPSIWTFLQNFCHHTISLLRHLDKMFLKQDEVIAGSSSSVSVTGSSNDKTRVSLTHPSIPRKSGLMLGHSRCRYSDNRHNAFKSQLILLRTFRNGQNQSILCNNQSWTS